MGGITNETVHLSFAVDWSKEVNPLLAPKLTRNLIGFHPKLFANNEGKPQKSWDKKKPLVTNMATSDIQM